MVVTRRGRKRDQTSAKEASPAVPTKTRKRRSNTERAKEKERERKEKELEQQQQELLFEEEKERAKERERENERERERKEQERAKEMARRHKEALAVALQHDGTWTSGRVRTIFNIPKGDVRERLRERIQKIDDALNSLSFSSILAERPDPTIETTNKEGEEETTKNGEVDETKIETKNDGEEEETANNGEDNETGTETTSPNKKINQKRQ